MLRWSVIVLVVLAGGATSQKVCDALNDGPNRVSQPNPGTRWHCIVRVATPSAVTGIEFGLRGIAAGSVTVGVWSIDQTTGLPSQLLTSNTVQPTLGVGGMYGASFPSSLGQGQQFYAGVDLNGVATPVAPSSGQISAYYYLDPARGWQGPGPGIWAIRVYCGAHGGSYTNYGAGKPGTQGVPLLRGLGFPNTSNPISLQVSGGLPGAGGVWLIGARRAALPIPPLGSLLVDPLITVPFVLKTGVDSGSFALDYTVPNDPAWKGARVACQAFLIDAGASGGVSHTAGVEAVFGH